MGFGPGSSRPVATELLCFLVDQRMPLVSGTDFLLEALPLQPMLAVFC